MERINSDNLDFNHEDYVYTYHGAPFTGVAFDLAKTGELVAEMTLVDGVQEGPVREWYRSGAKRVEKNLHYGALHGISMQWFESGKLQAKRISELGVCIELEEWDGNGNPISQYKLTETDPNYKTLQLLRQKKWKP